ATTYFDGKVPVSDKNIQFTGRWENNGKTATAYYQSSLEFKFTGNFIKIDTSKPVIASVDGGPWKKVGAGLNTVASGLERGEHTLRVMSTPDNPNPVIKGFYIAPEQKTVKTTAKKKIMFIGDKGALCSKKFEESYMLGISQKLDCSIAATVSNVGAKELCTSYFKLDEAGTKSYTADTSTDCIVLSLNTTGGKADYTQLVSVLRKNYPNSSIVCVAPASAKNASDIKSIVAGEQKDGDKKIFFVNADEWEVELSSDGVTPTADGAKTITSKLSSILKKIVGGNVVVNVTSKKPTTNTKDDKTSSVEQETTNDENEVVEEIVEEIVEEEVVQGNTVADYLWIIILVAVVVILSLLVIIFWPNIKKLFAAKK
ncbi:MAG: hypothetical protein J6I80_03950, partial [Clostridia bacterium]|nr:hypothetical protein [Clostridia bacterium]